MCMQLLGMIRHYRAANKVAASLEKAVTTQTLRGFTAWLSESMAANMKVPFDDLVEKVAGQYLRTCMERTVCDLQNAGVGFVSVLEDGITLWERGNC